MLTRRQIRSGSGLPCMGAIRNTGFPRHDGRRGSETGGKVMIGSMQGRVIFMALALLLSVVLTSCGGPMDDTGVDLATNRLKVMGQDVVVDASAVFDNLITSLADLRALQGANVSHPELEVHGSADNNGVIHATFITKWSDDRIGGRVVQVRGTVAGAPTATTLVIGRKTGDFSGALAGLPAGVVSGSFVGARGT